jgi:hypothetical protein
MKICVFYDFILFYVYDVEEGDKTINYRKREREKKHAWIRCGLVGLNSYKSIVVHIPCPSGCILIHGIDP